MTDNPESQLPPDETPEASQPTPESATEQAPESAVTPAEPAAVVDVHEPHHELPDGLRAWQAAVVRLWSASDETFATLAITRLPDGTDGAPWTASLNCGEEGEEAWSEDVKVTGARTIQQALQRLWDRARVRHGLFEDEADPQPLPSDFPADSWLTTGERALIDRLVLLLRTRQTRPVALRLSYHPDLGLDARWAATLHDPAQTLPEGTYFMQRGARLTSVCQALIKEIDR